MKIIIKTAVCGLAFFIMFHLNWFKITYRTDLELIGWCLLIAFAFVITCYLFDKIIESLGCFTLGLSKLALIILPWIVFKFFEETLLIHYGFHVDLSGFAQVVVGFGLMLLWIAS